MPFSWVNGEVKYDVNGPYGSFNEALRCYPARQLPSSEELIERRLARIVAEDNEKTERPSNEAE